jgi:hypothetical protein
MYNQLELVRAQLQSLVRTLGNNGAASDVRAAADSLERKAIAIEEHLHQLRATGRGQDNIRWPIKLIGQIGYLANGVASSDFAPTTQQVQVHELFKERIRTHRGELDRFLSQDVGAFNQMLRQRNIAGVIAPVREGAVP